jgi:hypothetical protein
LRTKQPQRNHTPGAKAPDSEERDDMSALEIKSASDVTRIWKSAEYAHLSENDIKKAIVDQLDPAYLIERGASDLLRMLRNKHRREVKRTTDQQAEWDAMHRTRAAEDAERIKNLTKSADAFWGSMLSITENIKEQGRQEAWAEMDKWRIKGKPLRLVEYDELLAERNQDWRVAQGTLSNVEFYDGVLRNMNPGQSVGEAMSESDVIAIRDAVFSHKVAA